MPEKRGAVTREREKRTKREGWHRVIISSDVQ